MGRIQSNTGLITGINIADTVDKLMGIESQPRDRLVARNKSLQTQQVALNQLTALVIGVQLATDQLGRDDTFKATSVTSSSPSIIAASSNGSPAEGRQRVTSVRLAQNQQLTSSTLTGADQTLETGSVVLRTGGFVDQSTLLDNLQGGGGFTRGKFRLTDRSGASADIDLRFAQNVNDVLRAINTTSGVRVNASINGDRIVLKDLTGQTTSNLKVDEIESGTTAAALGLSGINSSSSTVTGEDLQKITSGTRLSQLLDGRGVVTQSGNDIRLTLRDGSQVNVDFSFTATSTVGNLLSAINTAGGTKITAKIAADGDRLEIVDNTSGSTAFKIEDLNSGRTASELGLATTSSGTTIQGTRLLSGLNGPLLSSLNGGNGIGNLGTLSLTDRSGASANVNLSSAETLDDVIRLLNGSGVGIAASINSSKTGIILRDTTGQTTSSLIVANADSTNTATKLSIAVNSAVSKVDSGSLKLQFVNENTSLSQLNQGRGVRLGSISITDSAGKKAGINFSQLQVKTVGDVLSAINGAGVGVRAQLTDDGSGITLVDTANGPNTLSVTEVGSGKSALDLKILGNANSQTIGSSTAKAIRGSENTTISVSGSDTVQTLIDKLNASESPVAASLLTLGANSGSRLVVTSKASGGAGRFQLDSTLSSFSFAETSRAQDALISIGSSDQGSGVLVASGNNQFNNAISGVSLTIKDVSTTAVDISVGRDSSALEKQLDLLVSQYNKVIDNLANATKFDANTKTTGVLFGSTEALRVQTAFGRLFSSRLTGTGTIRSVAEIGINIKDDGKLSLDKEKLGKKLDTDRDAVQEFFAKANTGFSAQSKKLIDSLAGVGKSLLINRNNALQAIIDQNNKRVDTMNLRLDQTKLRLETQFYNMEAAISKIQSNLGSFSSISANLLTSSNSNN